MEPSLSLFEACSWNEDSKSAVSQACTKTRCVTVSNELMVPKEPLSVLQFLQWLSKSGAVVKPSRPWLQSWYRPCVSGSGPVPTCVAFGWGVPVKIAPGEPGPSWPACARTARPSSTQHRSRSTCCSCAACSGMMCFTSLLFSYPCVFCAQLFSLMGGYSAHWRACVSLLKLVLFSSSHRYMMQWPGGRILQRHELDAFLAQAVSSQLYEPDQLQELKVRPSSWAPIDLTALVFGSTSKILPFFIQTRCVIPHDPTFSGAHDSQLFSSSLPAAHTL